MPIRFEAKDDNRSLGPAQFDELVHDEIGQTLGVAALVQLHADGQHPLELLLQVAFPRRFLGRRNAPCTRLSRPFKQDVPVDLDLVQVVAPQSLVAELGDPFESEIMGPLKRLPGLVAQAGSLPIPVGPGGFGLAAFLPSLMRVDLLEDLVTLPPKLLRRVVADIPGRLQDPHRFGGRLQGGLSVSQGKMNGAHESQGSSDFDRRIELFKSFVSDLEVYQRVFRPAEGPQDPTQAEFAVAFGEAALDLKRDLDVLFEGFSRTLELTQIQYHAPQALQV